MTLARRHNVNEFFMLRSTCTASALGRHGVEIGQCYGRFTADLGGQLGYRTNAYGAPAN